MSPRKLNTDEKIDDLMDQLAKPEDYLIGVKKNMENYEKEHGDAYLRIGVTGAGRAPHYRLEPSKDRKGAILDEHAGDPSNRDERLAKYYVAFNGRSHAQMPLGIAELRGASWSSSYTDLTTVRELFIAFRQERQQQRTSKRG